eukprot:670143-Rhodomonas_salina.1
MSKLRERDGEEGVEGMEACQRERERARCSEGMLKACKVFVWTGRAGEGTVTSHWGEEGSSSCGIGSNLCGMG